MSLRSINGQGVLNVVFVRHHVVLSHCPSHQPTRSSCRSRTTPDVLLSTGTHHDECTVARRMRVSFLSACARRMMKAKAQVHQLLHFVYFMIYRVYSASGRQVALQTAVSTIQLLQYLTVTQLFFASFFHNCRPSCQPHDTNILTFILVCIIL